MNIFKILSTKGLIQIKNSFDIATIKKIIKGALISATGAFAIYILSAIGKIDLVDANTAAIAALVISNLTNIIKEWVSGENSK
jgi:hypothetical protein